MPSTTSTLKRPKLRLSKKERTISGSIVLADELAAEQNAHFHLTVYKYYYPEKQVQFYAYFLVATPYIYH